MLKVSSEEAEEMRDELPESRPEEPETSTGDGGELISLEKILQRAVQTRGARLEQTRPRLERFIRLNYPEFLGRLGDGATVRDFVLAVEGLAEYPRILDFLDEEMESPAERVRHETRSTMERLLDLEGDVLLEALPPVPDGLKSWGDFRARKRFPGVAQAQLATKKWVDLSGPPLLTLTGQSGTGKTHLAQGAVGQLQQMPGRRVAYFIEAQLIQFYHDGILRKDVGRRMDALCRVDWLVVDDLGEQATSDWDRGKMDELIDVRWDRSLRTMFTTNLLGPDLPPRIASRLGDTVRGTVVTIKALDYRVHGA
jgi:hypothetical protein